MSLKSGQMIITEFGKIAIGGELFDSHTTDPRVLQFEGYIDTGCTYDLVIPRGYADTVCAQIESNSTVSVGGGSSSIEGTIRKVNIRLGGITASNVSALVPNNPSSDRVLIGIGLLQKMSAFIAIDFRKGSTEGGVVTTDRNIPFLIGKALHYKLIHNKNIIPFGPCEFCGQQGKLD